MVPPPPAARPVARTDVWDVDPSTMDAMEIDVDAFIVKLRVARDNAFLLRTGGVMLAGGWTPGRDASTMKGKVQVATSPALMYTHQVCFSIHSVLDVRLRGRGARQVVVRARVAGGPFFFFGGWRAVRGFAIGAHRAGVQEPVAGRPARPRGQAIHGTQQERRAFEPARCVQCAREPRTVGGGMWWPAQGNGQDVGRGAGEGQKTSKSFRWGWLGLGKGRVRFGRVGGGVAMTQTNPSQPQLNWGPP
jgi:hypothetical protein